MTGLDPSVAVHRLGIRPEAKPVKQPQRRFRPDLLPSILAEVDKTMSVSFGASKFRLAPQHGMGFSQPGT